MGLPQLAPRLHSDSRTACRSHVCVDRFNSGFAAMWQHFHSDAVEPLLEKFTGFVRVPLADAPEFEKWYDDLVEQYHRRPKPCQFPFEEEDQSLAVCIATCFPGTILSPGSCACCARSCPGCTQRHRGRRPEGCSLCVGLSRQPTAALSNIVWPKVCGCSGASQPPTTHADDCSCSCFCSKRAPGPCGCLWG